MTRGPHLLTAGALALACLLAACSTGGGSSSSTAAENAPPPESSVSESAPPAQESPSEPEAAPAPQKPEGISQIFVRRGTNGTDDGFHLLVAQMAEQGEPFHRTADTPGGLIAADDVVLLKINCQWAERGGTNTDLIAAVMEEIAAHPEGFTGEIIVADNGQAQYGTAGNGGSLDYENTNSADRTTSALEVVGAFKERGVRATGALWDEITETAVAEYSEGDSTDGFVVAEGPGATGITVSYPKFATDYGTMVSFKEGIWDGAAYDSDKLKVINMPVLKAHATYHVTASVKNYMGVPSDKLSRATGRPHNSVASGGMGELMASTRMPALNVVDMIYISPMQGPNASYGNAVEYGAVAASADPFALDFWCAKHVLIPEAEKLGGRNLGMMDPEADTPGSFGYWMNLSLEQVRKAGFPATMNEAELRVFEG